MHDSSKCGDAVAECVAGTPNALGACVCQTVALRQVGPVGFAAKIGAGAFGTDKFYWSQDWGLSGNFSDIVAGPIGNSGQTLVRQLVGSVDRMRVTQDEIFVDGSEGLQAFSLSGAPLAAPDAGVAFPDVTSQVTSTAMGLFRAGQQLSPKASSYAETDTGVYYVPDEYSNYLKFVAFDQPGTSRTVASVSGPTLSAPAKGFSRVWVSGSNLYLETFVGNGGSHIVNYGDLSVIGQ